ncbi:MAG: hypothetical protein JXO72_02100 [Vicinamibacteria bacterium]|nr:hypothetical protein [Vicinamibacteria bacterium]
MNLLPAIRELIEHNYWARDRQLRACVALTQKQFPRQVGGSFASIRDTLTHLLWTHPPWRMITHFLTHHDSSHR